MDISSLLSTFANSDSVAALSRNTGAKPNQVKELLSKALPILMSGMQQNASTTGGAASLAKALDYHAERDTSDIGSFLSNVDVADGAKILGHILGGRNTAVQTGLAQKVGLSSSQVGSILSSVAPLLLSFLGNKKQSSNIGSGGLGGLLGSLLGGSSGGSGLGGAIAGGGLDSVISSALADNDGDGTPDLLQKVGGIFGF
ncbi:MAG: DUF937 domain-containing protein [Tannerella sp.]|jgi:hypothetical protein|nr:DUF937 domain-containing protein [Tannerella sp.]